MAGLFAQNSDVGLPEFGDDVLGPHELGPFGGVKNKPNSASRKNETGARSAL